MYTSQCVNVSRLIYCMISRVELKFTLIAVYRLKWLGKS